MSEKPNAPSELYPMAVFPARVLVGQAHNLHVQIVPADRTFPRGKVREPPKAHGHDAVVELEIPKPDRPGEVARPIRLTVHVRTENFTIQGVAQAEILVPLQGPSPAVTFSLIGQQVGPGRIMLDFEQEGRPAGSVDLHPEVKVTDQTLQGLGADLIFLLLGASAILDWLYVSVLVLACVLLLLVIWKAVRWTTGTLPEGTARREGKGGVSLSSQPSPPDIVIRVYHLRCGEKPGRLLFFLQGNNHLRDLPLDGDLGQQELNIEVAEWVQKHVYNKLLCLASDSSADAKEVQKELSTIGNNLFRDLLPEKMKERYWQFCDRDVSSMQILSDEPNIPWELIKPFRLDPSTGKTERNDEYWGVKFALTRWPRNCPNPPDHWFLQQIVTAAAGGKAPSGSPASAFSGSPVGALVKADEEVKFLLSLQEVGLQVKVLQPRSGDVRTALEKGNFDLFHLASHGRFGGSSTADASAVEMEDKPFRVDDISIAMASALHRKKPLFFFNACHSGRIGYALSGLGSWAIRLIEHGSGGFIGPLWPVTDEAALQFARVFYQALLKGEPIGRAMRTARREVCDAHPNDPTWLAYSCFADPLATVRFNPRVSPKHPGPSPEPPP